MMRCICCILLSAYFLSCSAATPNGINFPLQHSQGKVFVRAIEHKMHVTWEGDSNYKGQYTVELEEKNGNQETFIQVVESSAMQNSEGKYETIFSVSEGIYTIKIFKVNVDGVKHIWATAQNEVTVITAAVAPLPVIIQDISPRTSLLISGDADISVADVAIRWIKPKFKGILHDGSNALFTYYTVYWRKENVEVQKSAEVQVWNYDGKKDTNTESIIVEGLEQGKKYAIAIMASNEAGLQSISETKVITIPKSKSRAPAAPRIGDADIQKDVRKTGERKGAIIILSWDAPDPGLLYDGSPAVLKSYYLRWQWRNAPDEEYSDEKSFSPDSSGRERIVIDALQLATNYEFTVEVENSEGNLASTTIQVESLTGLSTAPTDVYNIRKDNTHKAVGELKITWDAGTAGSGFDGITPAPTMYNIYIAETLQYNTIEQLKENTNYVASVIDTVSYTFTNLRSAVAYDVVIVALNALRPDLKSQGSPVSRLTSNGIRDISVINHADGTPVTDKISRGIFSGALVLYARQSIENIVLSAGTPSVAWSSSNVDVAEIVPGTENSLEGNIRFINSGETIIEVRSQLDREKFATVTLEVLPQDIQIYSLKYTSTSELNAHVGTESVFSGVTTIPKDASLEYAVRVSPSVSGITIDSLGSITVDRTVPEGRYDLTVDAKVSASERKYSGSISVLLNLYVYEMLVIYKPNIEGRSKSLFTFSDATNPVLLQINSPRENARLSAVSISITGLEENSVYYQEVNRVFDRNPDGTWRTGLSYPVDMNIFNTLPEILSISVELMFAGLENQKYRLNVVRADARDLFTWRDIMRMNSDLSQSYTLQNNIIFPDSISFTPIGTLRDPFTGTFDGGGYTISNLFLDKEEDDYVGFFGFVDNADIRNVVIHYRKIIGKNYVGGLIGYATNNSEIVNVGVSGSSKILSAEGQESNNAIEGSWYVGGLVGQLDFSSIRGYAEDVVVRGNAHVGGLAGYTEMNAKVFGYTEGTVDALMNVGALVGTVTSSSVVGFARGTVIGQLDVGGLVGAVQDSTSRVTGYARNIISIENTHSTRRAFGMLIGNISNANAHIQGYYSLHESAIITDPDVDLDLLAGSNIYDGMSIFMQEDTTRDSFDFFDFGETWEWLRDGVWPAIKIGDLAPAEVQPVKTVVTCVMEGENKPKRIGDFYEIKTWEELLWMSYCLNHSFTLGNDIRIPDPGTEGIPQTGFSPIGGERVPFSGRFDGRGYTISNLMIKRNSEDYVGLFGYLDGAEIRDLTVEHNGVTGGKYVGALAGYAADTNMVNTFIETSQNAVIKGSNFVGGLVGYVRTGSSVYGSVAGTVQGSKWVGGLVGYAKTGSTVRGFSTGDVQTPQGEEGLYMGGLVGWAIYGSRVSGYTTGNVSGNNYVGGLVGYTHRDSRITGYAIGDVTGASYVGGLVGSVGYSIVKGYTRNVITRSNGNSLYFGFLTGTGNADGYYSLDESRFNIHANSSEDDFKGNDGIGVSTASLSGDNYESVFSSLAFSDNLDEWTRSPEMGWPIINIKED